jgi:hypothetical protein
MEPVEMKNL